MKPGIANKSMYTHACQYAQVPAGRKNIAINSPIPTRIETNNLVPSLPVFVCVFSIPQPF